MKSRPGRRGQLDRRRKMPSTIERLHREIGVVQKISRVGWRRGREIGNRVAANGQ